MKPKIDYKKAAWMRKYEAKASEVNPNSAGRLCWDTATHAYNEGRNAEDAAVLIVGMGRGIRP